MKYVRRVERRESGQGKEGGKEARKEGKGVEGVLVDENWEASGRVTTFEEGVVRGQG